MAEKRGTEIAGTFDGKKSEIVAEARDGEEEGRRDDEDVPRPSARTTSTASSS